MKTKSQEAFEAWAFPNSGNGPNPNIAVGMVFQTPDGYSQETALLWYAWQAGQQHGYESAINFIAGGA